MATIGVRDHTGWAVVVVLGGPAKAPELLRRERLTLCPPDVPRQLYHAANEDRAHAAAIVDEVERAARDATEDAFGSLLDAVAADQRVSAVAVPVGPARLPVDLEEILSSHAYLHAAEGALYRTLLVATAESRGIPVTRFTPKSVIADAAKATGTVPEVFAGRLRQLGAGAGPPWQQDHREAAAAALLAGATRPAKR
jgi:hypothetical protein